MRFYAKLAAFLLLGYVLLIFIPETATRRQAMQQAGREFEAASMRYAAISLSGHACPAQLKAERIRAEKAEAKYFAETCRYCQFFGLVLADRPLANAAQ